MFFIEMLKFLIVAMLSALVIIVLAKFVLQLLIRRPADYYEKAQKEQDDLMMAPIREAEAKRKAAEKKGKKQ